MATPTVKTFDSRKNGLVECSAPPRSWHSARQSIVFSAADQSHPHGPGTAGARGGTEPAFARRRRGGSGALMVAEQGSGGFIKSNESSRAPLSFFMKTGSGVAEDRKKTCSYWFLPPVAGSGAPNHPDLSFNDQRYEIGQGHQQVQRSFFEISMPAGARKTMRRSQQRRRREVAGIVTLLGPAHHDLTVVGGCGSSGFSPSASISIPSP